MTRESNKISASELLLELAKRRGLEGSKFVREYHEELRELEKNLKDPRILTRPDKKAG